ncbi:serine/threonine protein kinase [Myxococcus xanthus]|uniref:serine/threonine protein kinase n=1 Tax=Myxococcus xanthus TaxID=34 RepID=UPI00112A8371|nr:serine/threonine-protein kinase [Myxococcus xanthus]
MPLKYPNSWKYPIGTTQPAPRDLINRFIEIATDLAGEHKDEQSIIEIFKSHFGDNNTSSSASWAVSDLQKAMDKKSQNAPVFIDNFWSALETVRQIGLITPPKEYINSIITEMGLDFEIQPPELIKRRSDATISDSLPDATKDTTTKPTYTKGEQIGFGGFGTVYMASRQTTVARFDVAIKVFHPSSFVQDAAKAKIRFQREVQAIQRLQHRGIVPYIDAGFDDQGRPFLVMPHIRGKNIRDAATSTRPRRRIELISEVLDALDHAHSNEVLHRDLKPSNILVRETDSQPIIVDFGLAHIIDQLDNTSLTTSLVGSIGYIPSEVIANPKERSPLHDIFSCAVMTYEFMAGRRPDPSSYEPLNAVSKDFSQLDRVLVRALGPARQRHSTASELRGDLLEASKYLSNQN